MDVRILIGKRIREIREQKSLKQKDLSYISDLDRSYIASVENGQRNISIVNINKIASALNTPLKEFFNSPYFSEPSNNTQL